MKDISLVMPVYNPQPDILRGMLVSIFASDGVDFELVAVNDGSTNGADAILREWDAAHPGRMKILDRENRGAGPSRNEGFLAAEGKYVWFVDADDGMRPGCLGEIVSLMEENRAEHLLINFDAADPGTDPPYPEESGTGVREVLKTFAFSNFYRAPWKRVLRRDFLSRIGVSFCNARTGQEDQAETIRWTLETDRLLYSDKVFYRYFIVPTSLSNCGHGPDAIESGLQVCDLFRGLAERFSEHRDWMLFFSLLAASDNIKLCSDALARLSREKDPPADVRVRLESLRETYRRIAYGPQEDRVLFNLYDRGRRTAFDEKRPEIESLKTSVRQLRSRAETAEKASAAKARRCAELEAALRKATARAETADAKNRKLDSSVQRLRRRGESLERRLAAMQASLSWRVTAPLRAAAGVFTGKRRVFRDGR